MACKQKCWPGYERVPGKKCGQIGSCRKKRKTKRRKRKTKRRSYRLSSKRKYRKDENLEKVKKAK